MNAHSMPLRFHCRAALDDASACNKRAESENGYGQALYWVFFAAPHADHATAEMIFVRQLRARTMNEQPLTAG